MSDPTKRLRNTPRQRRSATTLQAIMDAAERLIAADGQSGFTSLRLATDCGMSIGRLYYWFTDLDDVLASTVDRISNDWTTVVADTWAAEHDARIEALRRFLDQHPAAMVLALSGPPAPHRARLWAFMEQMFPGDAAVVAVAHLDWHRRRDTEVAESSEVAE